MEDVNFLDACVISMLALRKLYDIVVCYCIACVYRKNYKDASSKWAQNLEELKKIKMDQKS